MIEIVDRRANISGRLPFAVDFFRIKHILVIQHVVKDVFVCITLLTSGGKYHKCLISREYRGKIIPFGVDRRADIFDYIVARCIDKLNPVFTFVNFSLHFRKGCVIFAAATGIGLQLFYVFIIIINGFFKLKTVLVALPDKIKDIKFIFRVQFQYPQQIFCRVGFGVGFQISTPCHIIGFDVIRVHLRSLYVLFIGQEYDPKIEISIVGDFNELLCCLFIRILCMSIGKKS